MTQFSLLVPKPLVGHNSFHCRKGWKCSPLYTIPYKNAIFSPLRLKIKFMVKIFVGNPKLKFSDPKTRIQNKINTVPKLSPISYQFTGLKSYNWLIDNSFYN